MESHSLTLDEACAFLKISIETAMSDTLMPITDVCAATGYKKPTIYEWMRDGKFPRPVKIGRSVRWPSSEVDAWIKDKITSCPRSGQQ